MDNSEPGGGGGVEETQETITETPETETMSTEPSYEELTAQAKEIADKAEALRVSKLSKEEKEAEDKAKLEAEEASKNDKAPEEYSDFKMPKDTPVDEELLNDFKPLAKELNLSQDKAQKLIDMYASKVAPLMAQRQLETWNKQLETWKEECQKDSEIGGDKFNEKVLDAQRVINTIGTEELKKVFNDFGLGNNPELVRVFARMAVYLKEDQFVDGKPIVNNKAPLENRLYPNMK